MNMAGKKLSPDGVALRRYLAHVVTSARRNETWEALVERFKISKPQLFDVSRQTGGLGETALQRFSDALFGGSRDALTQAARDWASANPGAEAVVELDALNPKEAVRSGPLYRDAKPVVQATYDARDPYTPGDAEKTVEWYTERLLQWIKAERAGLLAEDPVPGATEVKPRRRKA